MTLRRHIPMLALAALAAAWTGSSSATAPAASPSDELLDLLSGIDLVPSRAQLDPLLSDSPAADLIALAADVDGDIDPGVRLRALRALSQYPDEEVVASLSGAVADLRDAAGGMDVLYLCAAMRSLGPIGGGDAVGVLKPLLDHPSPDVRAEAATALGDTGSNDAKPWLYQRLDVETHKMVQLALSAAIRRLGEDRQ